MGLPEKETAGQLVVLLVESAAADEDPDRLHNRFGTPAYRIAVSSAARRRRAPSPSAPAAHGNLLIVRRLATAIARGRDPGTALALFEPTEEVCMFALSAILIGVIGVFYVRRRSARKKQQAV